MSLLYAETVSAGKAPVAIRITRPYQTEDELLEHELETISRTGVVLVGAQARPEGVILRFEVALATGAAVLRGEGRVTGYKAAAVGSEPGLVVRFTRLDSKSKALVDKVAAKRDARRSSLPPPASSLPPPAPEPPPPPAPVLPAAPAAADATFVPAPPADAPPSAPRAPASAAAKHLEPLSRDEVLARLRERGKRLGTGDVGEILAAGAKRRRA